MAPLIALALIPVASQAAVDPQRLPFGLPAEATVEVGQTLDLRTLKPTTAEGVAAAADGKRFVVLGEGHTNPEHHRMQAQIIEALAKRGRDVIVGFEMFTRPKQDDLNPWTLGWWTEDEFIRRSEWESQWGFDYALYRPVFEAVKRYRLPMVALNVPRTWVKAVARGGLAALTPEQRSQLPADIDLGWKDHRKLFDAMTGGHPMTGAMGENMYAAQVLWDVAMADSALKYWRRTPRSRRTVIVVLAGAGHAMYGLGINGRIAKQGGGASLTVTMIEADLKAVVSRGIGDYVFAAPAPEAGRS